MGNCPIGDSREGIVGGRNHNRGELSGRELSMEGIITGGIVRERIVAGGNCNRGNCP